jgi:hypothetical protein
MLTFIIILIRCKLKRKRANLKKINIAGFQKQKYLFVWLLEMRKANNAKWKKLHKLWCAKLIFRWKHKSRFKQLSIMQEKAILIKRSRKFK